MAEGLKYDPSKSLILFDLDGTLTNPKLGITSGVQHALQKLGIEAPSPDELEFFIGPPMRQTFRQAYNLPDDQIDKAVQYYREYYDPVGWRQNEVYSGIPETLAALRDAGFRLGLATSKPTVFAERILAHFGLLDLFSVLAGSNLDGTREDKADVIRYALTEAGFDLDAEEGRGGRSEEPSVELTTERPTERPGDLQAESSVERPGELLVTMVGDRKYDIIGAKELGLRSVGVTYGFGSREELESAGADAIVDRPEELVSVLLHTRLNK